MSQKVFTAVFKIFFFFPTTNFQESNRLTTSITFVELFLLQNVSLSPILHYRLNITVKAIRLTKLYFYCSTAIALFFSLTPFFLLTVYFSLQTFFCQSPYGSISFFFFSPIAIVQSRYNLSICFSFSALGITKYIIEMSLFMLRYTVYMNIY